MSITLDQESTSKVEVETKPLPAEAPEATRFYRAIWRWHFYAGLFVIPFMLMLAITGIIYLFKPQLDALMYGDRLFVQPEGEIVPYTQQLATAQSVYPDAEITGFVPNPAPDRSSEVWMSTADGRNLALFINPYNAQFLGERDEDNNLQQYALLLHGELMIGTTGDRLIELAACWGLVLTITGIYLWWPRKGSIIWGTLLPRLKTKNRRLLWRDLHAVPGFWGVLVIIFMLITGLPWTGYWGDQFAKVWSRYPEQMWDAVPASTVLTGSLNADGQKVVPWAVEQIPMPESSVTEHGNHQGQTASTEVTGMVPGTVVDLDSVIALAREQGAPPGFNVTLPAGAEGVYTVSVFPDDPTKQVTMHIDQYSGQVLADVRWSDYGLVPKAVEMGIALHEGKYFGLANQLLMLGACLIVILLAITSTVMWWQRRPAKRLGAPALPKTVPQLKVVAAIALIMGFLFPLMGISLVVVLVLDYVVISRIPSLKWVVG